MSAGFSPQLAVPATPAWYLFTMYLRLWCYLVLREQTHRWRASSHQSVPSPASPDPPNIPHTSNTSRKLRCFDQTLQMGGSKTPSLVLINLLEWLTELKEALLNVCQLIKEYDKGYRWTAREEIHWVRSGTVPAKDLLSPRSWGATPPPSVCSAWKLSEPLLLRFYGSFFTWSEKWKWSR